MVVYVPKVEMFWGQRCGLCDYMRVCDSSRWRNTECVCGTEVADEMDNVNNVSVHPPPIEGHAIHLPPSLREGVEGVKTVLSSLGTVLSMWRGSRAD